MAKKWLDSIRKQRRRSNLKFLKKQPKFRCHGNNSKFVLQLCHGELMAKKWLDSIEKRRRRIDLKERYKQTYRQAGRRLDSALVSDVFALAAKVGRAVRLRWQVQTYLVYVAYQTTHGRFCRKIAQIRPNVVAIATGVGRTTLYMVPLNRPSPTTPYQAQTSPVYLS